MPIAAAGIIPLIAGGASVASGIIGSNAAKDASNAQVQAANNAAGLQHQDAQAALDFQRQQYNNSLRISNPYLQTGYGALSMLRTGLGIPGTMPEGFSLPNGNTNAAALNPNGAGPMDTSFGNPDVMPAIGPGGINSNRFNSSFLSPKLAAQQAAGMTPQQVGTPGNSTVGQTSLPGGGFGVNPQLDPNDPTGQFNPGGTGQVPRTDGGTNGAGTAGGLDANGNPNIGFGSLLTPFSEQFKAPTGTNDPGYQFRLDQGMKALQNSAAAKGGLYSGGTAKSLNDYAQGSASQEYQNSYNRALNEYLNRFNIFNSNQTNQFNKLADVAGLGQTSANQLSTAGLTTGQNMANTLMTSGQQIGNDYMAAGNARGSGYINQANAITGGINNALSLYQLLNRQS